MKRKIVLAALIICLGFFLTPIHRSPDAIWPNRLSLINKELSVLTPEERKDVERLFEHFFFFDQFSYPIFGSKPMSIGRLLQNDQAISGWQAWKKIAPAFSSSEFVITDYHANNAIFILIANMSLIEKVYYENKRPV